MSEAVESQQTSIVFMGRNSFRMQIVGAEAAPEPTWASKTQRIIERRKSDRERRVGGQRRSTDAPADAPALAAEWPELPAAAAPMRRTIILISFVTFVSGAVVATAMDHLRRGMVTRRAAKAEVASAKAAQAGTAPHVQPPAGALPAAAPQPVAAPVVEPLPPLAPEFLEPRTAPVAAQAEGELRPASHPAVAKATPVPRGAMTPALRPRRATSVAATAPAAATVAAPRALNVDPFDEPPARTTTKAPAKTTARSPWVDPFAE